jgi:hypothetical protein
MDTFDDSSTTADPLAELEGVRWHGEVTYRVLSYYFSVRWNWVEGGKYVRRVLETFAVRPDPAEERNPPTPGLPARYSIVARGRGRERRYKLFYADGRMLSSPEGSNLLERFFWHVNAETIRRTGDFLLIHAGAVSTPAGEGVLIVGGSGSGKTTLTAGLVRRGFAYLSDDAGAIDPVTHRLYPYPKALSVKEGHPDLFPEWATSGVAGLPRNERHVLAEDIRPGCVSSPCDVRFVIAYRYEKGIETTLAPITPAIGILELSRNALNLPVYGSRGMTLLAEVAREAKHSMLVSGSLGDAVESVAELTRSDLLPLG